jgi:type I restriction enzyme S subunit
MAGYNISREVAVLPVKPPVVPDFVAFAVANITSQNWLNERAKGVAYTGINIEDLRLLPLPTPPPEEQVEIVRQVQTLLALADTIERRVQAATARADKLPQAILSKAFSGELVPTEAELARAEGRTYETAEELLKRVTADATAPAKTRKRKTA